MHNDILNDTNLFHMHMGTHTQMNKISDGVWAIEGKGLFKWTTTHSSACVCLH